MEFHINLRLTFDNSMNFFLSPNLLLEFANIQNPTCLLSKWDFCKETITKTKEPRLFAGVFRMVRMTGVELNQATNNIKPTKTNNQYRRCFILHRKLQYPYF